MENKAIIDEYYFRWNDKGVCLNPIIIWSLNKEVRWDTPRIKIAKSQNGWGCAISHWNGGGGVHLNDSIFTKELAISNGISLMEKYANSGSKGLSVTSSMLKQLRLGLRIFESTRVQLTLFKINK